MPVYFYDPPDRFVAGAVGQPGERIFYLQATAIPGAVPATRRSGAARAEPTPKTPKIPRVRPARRTGRRTW